MPVADYEKEKDVLVAYLPNKRDADILHEEHSYRIPKSTQKVPLMVRENRVKYIAFYLPKVFDNIKWSIQWFGEVENIRVVKGKDLIYKGENKKADKDYYKIEFKKLEDLPKPIYSQRGRRALFITTTQRHLKDAREFNDLFYESYIEEKLWNAFKVKKLPVERQYEVPFTKKKNYLLDFALLCNKGDIDIECDGDKYHNKKKSIEKDKERDSFLTSKGWNIMRFTSKKINYEFDQTIFTINEAIKKYGGIKKPENLKNEVFNKNFNKIQQDSLFE